MLLCIQLVRGEEKVQRRISHFLPALTLKNLIPSHSPSIVQSLVTQPFPVTKVARKCSLALCTSGGKVLNLYHICQIKAPHTGTWFIISWFVTWLSSPIKLEYIFRKVKMSVFKIISVLLDSLALRLRQDPGVWSRFSNSTLCRGRGVSISLRCLTWWFACSLTAEDTIKGNRNCFPIHLHFPAISDANIF